MGELNDIRKAALPIAAAIVGMALLFKLLPPAPEDTAE